MNLVQIKKELSDKTELTVKNYKHLCELIEEKPKTGNSKKAHLKEIRRHLKIQENEGTNEFKIFEVFETPLKKDDGRIEGNNSIYLSHFELILLHHMAKRLQSGSISVFEFTKANIMILTGMSNNKYFKEEELKNKEISEFNIKDFYRRTGLKFSKLIDTMLYNFKKRAILNIKEVYKIIVDNELITANKVEECMIIKAKKVVLNEMNFKNMQDIYLKFKSKKFYQRLNELLKELYDWDVCYKAWELSFCNDTIQNSINEYIHEINEVQKQRIELNQKIKESINQQAEDIFNKNEKDILENPYYFDDWGKHNKFKLNEDYVINQKMLCDYLISI